MELQITITKNKVWICKKQGKEKPEGPQGDPGGGRETAASSDVVLASAAASFSAKQSTNCDNSRVRVEEDKKKKNEQKGN